MSLAAAGGRLPAIGGPLTIDGGDDVEVPPVADGVMHHMAAGAEPQRDTVGVDVRAARRGAG